MTTDGFSADWFSHHINFWKKIFQSLEWNPNEKKTIIEIGSFEGRSTVWSCKNLLLHLDSKIFCIDTFQGSVEHSENLKVNLLTRFKNNIKVAGVSDKVRICQGESWHELSKLIADNINADMVYVDGSHQAPDVLEDACLALRILKTSGIVIFDDYHWSIEPHGREDILNSPKIAVDLFHSINRRRIKLFAQSAHQIAFQKTF